MEFYKGHHYNVTDPHWTRDDLQDVQMVLT